jgi:hypothetical protein
VKKPGLVSADLFDKTISESSFFKDKEISKEDETNASKREADRGFMLEFSVHE